ncbi:NADH:ubiquinone reductase (Na(+)-transporting) subunit C [Maliponia aquimaris]|uniref:Na(+)-translocating NADH-quinone reductase subunit C n=1 Tax=Maliponia aquimaris TaxID=1673631 RepID=A0A238KHU3_9RHOB|nr:NADH:ubiquinone reductase (Na(+)-transporting) subunit C [Maliponia aquimaris]SMX42371.1 Na(+)-translocating NADH-quinone reductase subunit C [Maliponia aquimaris]
MADLNPITAWKRLLALPNESRPKTLLVAFLTSVLCAALVTGATVVLRPIQAANRAAEVQVRLEALLSAIPGMTQLLSANPDAAVSTVVVDLTTGRAARDITPATLETALQDTANWTPLKPEDDLADLGARPDIAQVYVLRQGDQVRLLILPVAGSGYNGPIEAMLAINGDMQTIAGLTVTRQAETPGLGARIEEPAWQASFAGTRFADDSGAMRFAVAKGPSASDYEVDGITGATRTSNAVTRMVRFWLGPQGYGPLIEAVKRGEF